MIRHDTISSHLIHQLAVVRSSFTTSSWLPASESRRIRCDAERAGQIPEAVEPHHRFSQHGNRFPKMGVYPQNHRFQHSTGLLNDLGYPHFRKPPYGKIGIHGLWLGSVACAACDGKTGHQLAIPEKSSGPQQLFGLGSSLLQRIHLLLQLFQLLLPFFLPKVIGSSLAPWTSSILMLDAHGHATNLLVQFLLQPHGFQSNLPGSWKNQRLNGGSFRLHWSEAAEPLGLFIEMSLAT